MNADNKEEKDAASPYIHGGLDEVAVVKPVRNVGTIDIQRAVTIDQTKKHNQCVINCKRCFGCIASCFLKCREKKDYDEDGNEIIKINGNIYPEIVLNDDAKHNEEIRTLKFVVENENGHLQWGK